jgi:methyl-accepting chemotaxis protein
VLVVAKPVLQHGDAVAIVVCGIAASEGNTAFLGLSSIEQDIIQLADQVQAERQRAVADFLKIIRSIAKRIHLLALNASILSAQAGEQGRGFAVVAREIGDLAERTRLSTQELEQEFLGRGKSSDVERRTGGRSGRAA